MKIARSHRPQGIALVVVMVAIFVLALLAGVFAYAMKVETRLAQNSNNEANILWLGRSGVELARYVVAQQLMITAEPYDSLNQKWAGGPGTLAASNSPLADLSLDHYPVGNGTVSIHITDLERKININVADERMLEKALGVVQVDGSEIPRITGAILDWIDPDDVTRINGAESDYYQSLNPPYSAKNAPIDDLSELMMVRGVTAGMYWGSNSTNHAAAYQVDRFGRLVEEPTYPVGLVDIFTAMSSGRVNINTASQEALQGIPEIDANAAAQIVQMRAGPDGVDGTEDDTPFRNPGELINAGVSRQAVQQIARYCDVRSRTFDVRVDAEISGYHRIFHAILGRNSPQDVQILSFYWE